MQWRPVIADASEVAAERVYEVEDAMLLVDEVDVATLAAEARLRFRFATYAASIVPECPLFRRTT